jgi:hypothetical protein
MARKMRLSTRAAGFVGLMAAFVACGEDDGGQGGSAAEAGALTSAVDAANGTEGGSAVDASASGADANTADGAPGDGSSSADTSSADAAEGADGGVDAADAADAAVDAGADANGGTLVIRVDPRNDCTVTTVPPSPIKIPAGQWFHATFINVGEISTDIDKRDPFNLVPLVLGLEPGMTYADTIRPWCQGFSGKFWFEITPCEHSPSDLEVDCGP